MEQQRWTLNSYMDKFLSNIEPSPERIEDISESHNTLRRELEKDEEILYKVKDSFLSGSYARKTAINLIKVDMF